MLPNIRRNGLPPNLMEPWMIWHMAWRKQLRRIQTHPEEATFLSRAAAVAQAQYVMWQALATQ